MTKSRNISSMIKQLPVRKQQGQSALLLALVLTLLVAMTGLSVDVGHAYAEQRRVQQSANAAALAGMQAWTTAKTNSQVELAIKRSLVSNGIDFGEGTNYSYSASYVLPDGTTQLLRGLSPSAKPPRVERINVTVREEVDTYFARVVGRPTLPANATGYSCFGGFNLGVYPIGINVEIRDPLQKFFDWNNAANTGSSVVPKDKYWSEWHTRNDPPHYRPEYVKVPFHNKFDAMSGVHFPWLVWRSNTNHSNDTLNASLSYPGNLSTSQFTEATPPKGATNGPRPNELEPGDWLDVDPGTRTANESVLLEHATIGDVMILPMYHDPKPNGNGRSGNYVVQVQRMGMFKLVDAQQTGNDKFMTFEYMGTSAGSVAQCGNHPRTDDAVVSGQLSYDRLTANVDGGYRASDIVFLLSVSENMRHQDPDSAVRYEEVRNRVRTFALKVAEDTDLGPDQNMRFVSYGNPAGGGYGTFELPWLQGSFDITTTVSTQLNALLNDATVLPGNQRPGASALTKAEQIFSNGSPGGSANKKTIIMVVDGVMNVNLAGSPVPATSSTEWTSAAAQLTANRPLWQAQEVADRLHKPTSQGGLGAQVFVIALTKSSDALSGWFDTKGLRDISSGPGFYYEVSDKDQLKDALNAIHDVLRKGPAAHSGHGNTNYCNPTSQITNAGGIRVTLVDDSGNLAKETVTDASGNFTFTQVRPGDYTLNFEGGDGGPPVIFGHIYNRVINYDDRAQNGPAANNAINITADRGALVQRKLLLRAPLDSHSFTAGHEHTGESGCQPYIP